MKKLLLLSTIFLLQSGCMLNPLVGKIAAMEKAGNQGIFQGIDEDTNLSISLPKEHDGQFAAIDQLDFVIRSGKFKDKNASAIVVKYHDDSAWHVLYLFIQDGTHWVKIPKTKD